MLKFLVDASTGIGIAHFLQSQGHDVLFVDQWRPRAEDAEITQFAFESGRIIVTNDKDFGEKVYRDRLPHAGVLLLRLEDERVAAKVQVVQAVLQRYAATLPNHFVVATERRIRIRRSD